MGSNEKCPGRAWRASRTPMDINRETVVQLYFQSFPFPRTTIPRRSAREIIAPGLYLYFPFFPRYLPGQAAEKRQEAESTKKEEKKKKLKESLPAERCGRNIVGRMNPLSSLRTVQVDKN